MRRLFPELLFALATAACAGCVSTANDQANHSDGSTITAAIPVSDSPTYTTPDAPSVTGLSRQAWPQTVFNVPQREVENQQQYRSKPLSYTKSSAVQRQEFPTPETAGEDVTNGSRSDQALEALVSPFYAIGELIMMIPRAIIAPPATPARTPTEPVERFPIPPVVQPLPAAPASAPATPTQPTTQPTEGTKQ